MMGRKESNQTNKQNVGVRLLTGMDQNGQEWASITGMDLKIPPKIHVLSVLDKKFWLSNVKYQISSM